MPNRNPMTGDELLAFLDELTKAERKTFDRMRAVLKQKGKDLNWYRTFGQGVLDLRGARDVAQRYGRISRLARALDCSASLLNKTRDFAREYTSREVKTLVREGITWGLVYPTFPVEGKEEQMAWMRRARDEGLTVHQLEKEIQKETQGPKRKGGRRRRELRSYGHAVDLLILVRVSEEWLRHHREVWATASVGLLDQLMALSPVEYSNQLLQQLEEAERALEKLAQAASSLRGQFEAMLNRMKRPLDATRR